MKKPSKAKTMKKSKSSYKKAKKLLDDTCKAIVKARDRELYDGLCPLCGVRPIKCWYHFVPCGATAIRWHMENSCGACNGCNMEERNRRGQPLFMDKLHTKHAEMFGRDSWKNLEDMARIPFKKSAAELLEMVEELQDTLTKEN